MQRAGAKAFERVEMFGSRIALVRGKSIARVLGVEPRHQPVAVDFGDDGGGADGDALRVAPDDGLLRIGQVPEAAGVDQ